MKSATMRILLAEDSRVNQAMAMRLLEKLGHSVHVADDGKKAVAAFEAEAFDLILMDVLMPEMGGLEATAQIREIESRSRHSTCPDSAAEEIAPHCGPTRNEVRKARSRVPIIAMTAHDRNTDRERCLEAGMDDYISKPVVAQQLLEIIERLAEGRAPGDTKTQTAAH